MVLRFFLFAVAFLFVSCTELGERDNPDDPHGINFRNSSSSGERSSSSAASPPPTSSSSSVAVVPSSSSSVPSQVPSSSSVAPPPPPSSSSSKPSSSSYVAPPPPPSSSSMAAPSSSSVAPPPSSSSSVPSSSSVATPSSSSVGSVPSGGKGNDISKYKTKQIGTQNWMAENLNYAVAGSKCGSDDGKLKEENTSNCDTYGRLYNWVTAMNLPASCNSSSCSGQIKAKHQGICPSGWHIPSQDDWDVLKTAVGGASTAGTELKATSGWNASGNGQDTYGFSALPGGLAYSSDNFDNVGLTGLWWSATEYRASDAYYQVMSYNYANVSSGSSGKFVLYSVRCVQD